MITIIPAIIPDNIEEIENKISLVKDLPKNLIGKVQLDFIDGKYAPSITWPFSLGKEIEEKLKLPYCDEIVLEADLMIKHPEDLIEDFIDLGIKSFVIHIDSTNYLEKCIHSIKDKGLRVGLGIKPSGDFENLNNLVQDSDIDFVQFMGNNKVGYNGVELDYKVLRKIALFHADHPLLPLQIDIGVNFKTAPDIIRSGITSLVSGSAVFGRSTEDPELSRRVEENIQKLKTF